MKKLEVILTWAHYWIIAPMLSLVYLAAIIWLAIGFPVSVVYTMYTFFHYEKFISHIKGCVVEGECANDSKLHRFFEAQIWSAHSRGSKFGALCITFLWGPLEISYGLIKFGQRDLAKIKADTQREVTRIYAN